jgi:putative Holliday junction resolvase
MKYIGLDYGTKKCGLAVSDDRGVVAVPWKIVATNDLLGELAEMLKNEKFKRVVVGESINSKGEHNPVFADVEKFVEIFKSEHAQKCESGNLEIFFEKEFFSSKHARSQDGKREVDDRAAALILQRFLDKQNRSSVVEDGGEYEE